MIERLDTPQAAADWCQAARERGQSIGFVPTMGALHDGHLSLARAALAGCDLCVVSVFVNPLQFDEATDLETYPRDWEGDAKRLGSVGCQMVFTGSLAQFFEGELESDGALAPERLLAPGRGALGLEGACRTGHFEGVATIVDRLFEVVHPDRAYFGQKDFQQTLVVEEVARRRGAPQIVVCPISREESGLARSSRNERLRPQERERAVCLSRGLSRASHRWQHGLRDLRSLEAEILAELEVAGVQVEYAAIRERSAWSPESPVEDLHDPVALVAARLGQVRLIDNHLLGEVPPHPASAFKGLEFSSRP